MTAPAAFERERRDSVGAFMIYGDRKAAPFVMLRSGLSHNGGHVQYILSPAEAKQLGEALVALAEFAAVPLPGDR